MSVTDAPAGTGRPRRRWSRVATGVAFALTPWVTLGFGTPVAFLIAAVVFSRSQRAHARVLWISAALYTGTLIADIATVGPQSNPGAIFTASTLITMVGGGLQALFTLRVAAIRGPGPARSRRQRRDRHDRVASARPTDRRPGGNASRRTVTAVNWVAAASFIWIVPLATAGTMIPLGATEMDQSIRAADGQGIPGVVVPTDENCGGDGPCSWTGNFTSSSGRLRLRNVDIASGAQAVGKPFSGLYEGSAFIENQVYPYGSHQWIRDIWFLIFGTITLSLPATVTINWWRKRRRQALPQGTP